MRSPARVASQCDRKPKYSSMLAAVKGLSDITAPARGPTSGGHIGNLRPISEPRPEETRMDGQIIDDGRRAAHGRGHTDPGADLAGSRAQVVGVESKQVLQGRDIVSRQALEHPGIQRYVDRPLIAPARIVAEAAGCADRHALRPVGQD